MNEEFFYKTANIEKNSLEKLVDNALHGMDDGELFIEISKDESFVFDDGKLRNASFDTGQGFGLRGVADEAIGYAHSSIISEAAIKKAAETVMAVRLNENPNLPIDQKQSTKNHQLYTPNSPLEEVPFKNKVKLLEDIDAYLRGRDPRVRQVTASLSGEWQAVMVMRAGGQIATDFRPLVRLNVSVTVEDNQRMEKGSSGAGGRAGYLQYITPEAWKEQADEALRQAFVNLESIPAPAGELPVVLGSGWPAVLLHEAVGHGLEGDFNRKKTSVFSELMGQQVASKGVTVIDDGTIEGRRGSLNIDDEGTPTKRNVLIEDGKLVGLMQDRMNARLMGVEPTGNGRRESYACRPMPRMTNTFMLDGKHTPEEIISSVKNGIYAPHFGGGQVDITNGNFVFSASEAYKIENGKITQPIKGATLIGQGIDVMRKIEMIGNDMQLDKGVGMCGKDGQGVPVGVGQPTLKISSMTIGGTEVAA
ncbi:MAG: metalloprotease TldD [Alphaproteobacteria bacterium CG11_big_fil_rev_8_21_14_0_20_44_7]|nr:MAG: metalloprotease TldD [Alphaproteobacteria bacterium CG11_big_fil_rev_8_21_14_0_20_44_7]